MRRYVSQAVMPQKGDIVERTVWCNFSSWEMSDTQNTETNYSQYSFLDNGSKCIEGSVKFEESVNVKLKEGTKINHEEEVHQETTSTTGALPTGVQHLLRLIGLCVLSCKIRLFWVSNFQYFKVEWCNSQVLLLLTTVSSSFDDPKISHCRPFITAWFRAQVWLALKMLYVIVCHGYSMLSRKTKMQTF